MHGSNGNGASLGRLEDSTPNSQTQLITGASTGNSTPNPNQPGTRNGTQSQPENALFTNTTHNEQDTSGITNTEPQSLGSNLVDSRIGEANLNAHGVKTHSCSFDSQIAAKIQGARGEHSESGAAIKEPFTMNPYARSKSRMQLRKAMIVRYINLYYKKWVLEGLLRRRELPPTKDGRHIILDASRGTPFIDERTGKGYINNSVRSSRYTIWTFIPGQLWFQFSKLANVYFLVMGILQLIPGLSTTGTYTTILPLLVFLVLTIAREGYDDFQRYRLDRVENRRMVRVLYGFKPGGIEGQRDHSLQHKFKEAMERSWTRFRTKVKTDRGKGSIDTFSLPSESDDCDSLESDLWGIVKWTDVKVGDIIMLKRNEQVPADIVLLHAEGRDSIAYVETMALDGETNLKNRQPPRLLQCRSTSEISNCHAHFVVEDPNLDLYDFNGKVSVDGTTLPLTLDNVIYRGSTLRNTARAIGMVINTGEECKIRMNASKNPHTKAPAIQSITNKVVILLAVFVVLLAIGCTAGYQVWTDVYEKKAWYLAGAHVRWIDIFIGFAIMYNNLIPLALYVSLELIKFAQFLMLQDIEMYDPVSDTPMVSNTQNIYENLGQVNYIFSDKTGTLTENVMRFRKMSVAGTAWAHSDEVLDGHQTDSGTTMASRQVTNPGRDNSIQIHSPDTPAASRKQLSTDELLQSIQRNPSSVFAQKVSFFLLSLGICHTGFPEIQKNGEISFQAASPDELALLEAARDLGYAVTDRNSRSITLKTGSNVRETYEVLDVIEFSSKRKRMSIIVRCPNGRIVIFCKGADSVILSKCKLSSVALQAASRIERVHSQRISMEVEEAIVRKESRNSMQRPSLSLSVPGVNRRSSSFDRTGDLQQPRPSFHRPSLNLRPSMSRRSTSYEITRLNSVALDPLQSDLAALNSRGQSIDNDGFRNSLGLPRRSMGRDPSGFLTPPGQASATQKDYFSSRTDTDAVEFEHCLQHIHDFACEGLRTLVYGYRFIDEEEYTAWKKVYHSATTSLTGRQELIEAAAEVIEQNFEIAGATGIEDKLQIGVPETIDKLQRADIQIWMLTGDKRETAINIAQSARICKSYSHLITLDCANATVDIHQQITTALQELSDGEIPHSVVIIDGQTLSEIESDITTATKFYELLIKTDSVICCRASPSQKAAIVKNIRQKVKGSITLAIGDGGNDIAMIQEAHVGVGISGKEGLQAARVADYSIAQFRFLQRLLLVHGHWNYIRTAKFILLTFWKEMLFYSVQILYQRWNGYTGTSLFESASLTVWNTLFTSLPVMIPGIFEQDLSAATLLAVPELYGYGQRNQGFNMRKYTYWMIMAGSEAVIIYFLIYYLYGIVSMTKDQSLFALGDLGFSVAVVFINVKLLVLQYHYKTWIPIFCCLLTIWGWWIWNILLSYIYAKSPGPYAVYHSFMEIFGRDIRWWAVLGVVLGVVICIEIVVDTVIIWGWPGEIQVWQEIEREEARKGRVVGERREEVEEM